LPSSTKQVRDLTVSPRPSVFISAVSRELKSARQLVANTLGFLGYSPVWQEIFGTESGDLREMLRQKIDTCKGVVQLVGQCYGAEPPTSDPQFGRVSYTQYEALYAQLRGKKVWYLFIDDNFPTDPFEPEPQELRDLQAAYRGRLQSDLNIFYRLTTRDALEASVLKLRDDLVRLRRGVKQWAATIAILLIVSVALGLWVLRGQRETASKVDQLTVQMQKLLRQGVAEYPGVDVQVRQAQPNADPAATQEEIYNRLSKQLGVNPQTLREKLPQFAEQLKRAPDVTSYQRANAAFVTSDYAEAERLALEAADQDLKAPPPEPAAWTPKGRGPPPCLPSEFVDPRTRDTWRFDRSSGQWWSYSSSGKSMPMGSGPPFPCQDMPEARRLIR
jgi:hypothetical protein